MDRLEEILISGPESDQQVRVVLTGLSGMEKRSTACELAHRLQEDSSFSIFWVNASTEDTINQSLVEMADLFPAVTATAGNASMRRRHLIHYLTWSFSGSWLMVLDGMNPSTSRYLAFEGLSPQALSGNLLFITSDPSCAMLLGSVKAVEVLGTYCTLNVSNFSEHANKRAVLVPHAYNPDFIGRSDILEKLKHQLGHGQHQPSREPRMAALLGLGGIGWVMYFVTVGMAFANLAQENADCTGVRVLVARGMFGGISILGPRKRRRGAPPVICFNRTGIRNTWLRRCRGGHYVAGEEVAGEEGPWPVVDGHR